MDAVLVHKPSVWSTAQRSRPLPSSLILLFSLFSSSAFSRLSCSWSFVLMFNYVFVLFFVTCRTLNDPFSSFVLPVAYMCVGRPGGAMQMRMSITCLSIPLSLSCFCLFVCLLYSSRSRDSLVRVLSSDKSSNKVLLVLFYHQCFRITFAVFLIV